MRRVDNATAPTAGGSGGRVSIDRGEVLENFPSVRIHGGQNSDLECGQGNVCQCGSAGTGHLFGVLPLTTQ